MIVKTPTVLKFYIKMYCQHRKEWSGICIARQSKFLWENYDDGVLLRISPNCPVKIEN